MKTMRPVTSKALIALLVVGLIASLAPSARAADEIPQRVLDRAHNFLKTEKRGKDVLSHVHFGSAYRGHSYTKTLLVTNGGKRVPGHFALVYTFRWAAADTTDVVFFCNEAGNVYKVQTGNTTAVFSQPFLAANLTVKALGNLIIAAFADQMTPADKKEVQKLVDDADAKGMLEWSLKFQQTIGL